MPDDAWRADNRRSYDTVAGSYAGFVAGSLARAPGLRAALARFAELVGDRGPVADVGCGPGHVTAHLRGLGLDAYGIDLSPAMVELARRQHPGVPFEVGDLTVMRPGRELGGVLAFWSLIHVPDEVMPATLAGFRRSLRPGGVLLAGFHVGDGSRLKTEGYGGLPMHVRVHRRRTAQMVHWLDEAGFRRFEEPAGDGSMVLAQTNWSASDAA